MFFKKTQSANNLLCKTLTWVVIAVFLLSTACTSTRTLTTKPDMLQGELNKGDIVKITKKDGYSFRCKIVDISSEAIIGDKMSGLALKSARNQKVLFNDIAKIERTQVNAGKTLLAVILGISLLIGTYTILFWSAGGYST